MVFNTKLSLDIDESSWKFLEWSVGLNKKINLKKCLTVPVCKIQENLQAKSVVKVSGFKAKKVLINISGQQVVTRIVKVPYMKDKDLAGYIELEISDLLPVDMESFIYDYRVLNKYKEEGREYYDVLLAGVPKNMIEERVKTVQAAGLDPLIVDVYPNAIARLFRNLVDIDVAVVDIGCASTHFTIFEKGVLFFYAHLPLGYGGVENTAEINKSNLSGTLETILSDINTYLGFYSSRHRGQEINKIHLISDLALVPGALEAVGRVLGKEVIGDIPLWCYNKLNNSDLVEVIPAYAVNFGLIMRSMRL